MGVKTAVGGFMEGQAHVAAKWPTEHVGGIGGYNDYSQRKRVTVRASAVRGERVYE